MHSRFSRRTLAALALFSLVFAACGGDDDAPPMPQATATSASTATPTATPSPIATVSFVARGSVGQVYVLDAAARQSVDLIAADGALLRSAVADGQGTALFRQVPPGDGYRVEVGAERSSPLRVSTADTPPPASFYSSQVLVEGYQYVETRDGTKLAINVVLPGPISGGPYPTVIEYSGYDPANPSDPEPSTRVAAALGFAAVGVNMRGSGCSGGAFDYFETLQATDGYDVVEIVAAQPWVKGNKVGMVGISYPGISQLFVAQLQPPHLAAITPLSVISDIARGILYPGGILNDGFAVQFAKDRQHDALPGGQRWSQVRIDAGDPVCIANQKLRGQTVDLMELILANPYYDAAVADPLSPVTFVDRIQVPVFLAGAWQDEQTGGYFANMLDRFTGTDKVHVTLVNGNHIEPFAPAIFARWLEFLDFYVAERKPQRAGIVPLILGVINDSTFRAPSLTLEPERFTGVATYEEALALFEAEPRIRVLFESGAGATPGAPTPTFEKSFADWPIPGLVPTALYLGDAGRLQSAAPEADGADTFVYDPSSSQRTNYPGPFEEVWRAQVAWDWQRPEEGEAVGYSSEPLTDDVVTIGSASADLWLEATAADVDLQVTLSEVYPDGDEVYVQSGWLRASHRKIDEARSLEWRPVQTHLASDAAELPAGEPVLARVEIFPFGHVFRSGSRIRLQVSAPGGDRPAWKFDALPASGEVLVTIAHAGEHPSRLVLPVIPGVEVPVAAIPCPGLRGQPCRGPAGE